ncbi:hypothetical protein DKT77_06780 [Meridianimarinicoccus roseus]|jgi:hypothetical protein|uniref:SseB protein N-terminal domain-containing protein n=1 Tax=Meridianimarinicoccus roseus TaxID=2072018 RepID=A0A2V2LMM9_9RHOB|nr:SseB family protein [Meridianimarinicoccus roseus]PWR03549.1 hypothetical protein DKT77_06780 [Meridianimarinicoccus roseus]
MTQPTLLDTAHAVMEAAPQDDALRLRFFERLADGELFLLLDREPQGDGIDPRIFDTEDGRFVLAFDREERLAEFAGGIAPYAALSGRTLAAMLTGQGLGLALNPDVAPSAMLLDPDAIAWLADTLARAPQQTTARARELSPPTGLPETLVTALDAKLASMAGRADLAYLADVTYDSGVRGHLLAFIGAAPGAEGALARAVNEALAFSGLEAGSLDAVFLRATDPVAARLARVGLRFDLPRPEAPAPRRAPGSDPESPPILR